MRIQKIPAILQTASTTKRLPDHIINKNKGEKNGDKILKVSGRRSQQAALLFKTNQTTNRKPKNYV